MGEKDTITKEFMDNNIFFADFCNYYIYNGQQIIQPNQLQAVDPKLTLQNESAKNRDILNYITAKTTNNAAYLIVGIENQSDIDYAMPVRNMLYDALQYDKQRKEIIKVHRNNKEYANYTSGVQKADKLLPVITIVVYFGSKPWDGPLHLHDMLDTDDPNLLRYVADYTIQLIDPHQLDEKALEKFKTNAREVMTFIKHAKDKEKILELVQEERYKSLDALAANVINVCTNSKLPLITNQEEDVNMCQAIDEIREDSRNEGIQQKAKEMALKLLKDNLCSLEKIAELTDLPLAEIESLQKAI